MAQPSNLISGEKLSVLTTLVDRRHRQLADQGYFPHPVEGQYQLVPTIAGILKYYREHNQRTRESLVTGKQEKMAVETRILQLKEAKELKKLADRGEVNKLLLHMGFQIKAVLYAALERELPGKCVGRSAAEIGMIGRDIGDRICEILRREVDQWDKQD